MRGRKNESQGEVTAAPEARPRKRMGRPPGDPTKRKDYAFGWRFAFFVPHEVADRIRAYMAERGMAIEKEFFLLAALELLNAADARRGPGQQP